MIIDCLGKKILETASLEKRVGILHEGTYGIEIEAESKSSYRIPKFTFWDVKQDDSLRDFGREYVLKVPVHYGDEHRSALEEFEKKTKSVNFIQDSISTSVHLHVNMLPEKWKTLGNFLTIYTMAENLLIEYSGEFRRNNLFCLPIRSVPYIHEVMIKLLAGASAKRYQFKQLLDQNQIKYAALNLATLWRFGSVELRSFRGSTDVQLIDNWIKIINYILEFSRQDVSPKVIMDTYEQKGEDLFKDIFQKDWKILKNQKKADELFPSEIQKHNIWYAGQFAYSLSEDKWNHLDDKHIPLVFPKEVLEKYCPSVMGIHGVENLDPIQYDSFINWMEDNYPNLAISKDQLKKVIDKLEVPIKKKKKTIADITNQLVYDYEPQPGVTLYGPPISTTADTGLDNDF